MDRAPVCRRLCLRWHRRARRRPCPCLGPAAAGTRHGRLHRRLPGNASANAAFRRLLRPCFGRADARRLGGRCHRTDAARQRLSRRDLARIDRSGSARPDGSGKGSQPPLRLTHEGCHPAAGAAHLAARHDRFPGAVDQRHLACIDRRLHRADASRQHHLQPDLPTADGLRHRRHSLFRDVLPTDDSGARLERKFAASAR